MEWIGSLPGAVAAVYEAGPTGFGLARFLLGHCQLEQSEGDFRRFASAIHQVACDV
ncbi:MAG: hypothetical protein ACXVHD_29625 [Solirubrobacteraceae bacterium]